MYVQKSTQKGAIEVFQRELHVCNHFTYQELELLLLKLLHSCNSVSEDMWDRNWMEVGGRCTRKSTRPQTLRLHVHHRVFGGESPNQSLFSGMLLLIPKRTAILTILEAFKRDWK